MNEEIQKKIDAQKKYCQEAKLPLFIPSNGVCWACHQNIFSEKGYTLAQANRLITSCPYCHKSFCD